MIHLYQHIVKEAQMKKLMKVFGIILLVVIAVVAALVIKGLIESKKALVKPD